MQPDSHHAKAPGPRPRIFASVRQNQMFYAGAGGDFGGFRNAEAFRKKGIAGAYAHSGIYRVCLIDNMLAPVATFEGT